MSIEGFVDEIFNDVVPTCGGQFSFRLHVKVLLNFTWLFSLMGVIMIGLIVRFSQMSMILHSLVHRFPLLFELVESLISQPVRHTSHCSVDS